MFAWMMVQRGCNRQ